MHFASAKFAKVVRRTAYPVAVVVLALILFSQVARTGDDANAIPVRLIVVNSAEDAQAIENRLKAGADFAVLAREQSVDPTSSNGGFLGKIDPASLRDELRDGLRALQPGQLSNIVQLPSSYAILQVLTEAQAADLGKADRALQSAISAEGSIRLAPLVGGQDEAMSRLFQRVMPQGWSQNLHAVCDAYRQSPLVLMKEADALVDPANKASPLNAKSPRPVDVMEVYMTRGQLHAYQGEMAQAVAEWEIAYRIASSDVPRAMPLLEEVLGVGYLHKSEMDNDVYRHPGDRCIFPMPPDLRYAQTASSAKAIQYFTKYLERKPGDIEVKWLLNLAYMTLGKYPSGIPQKYLLPLSPFTSGETIGRFTDVAPQAGLNLFAMASGVVVDDFENNGLFDVVTSTYDACEPMHYFHNNGDGTFSDHAAQAGLSDQLGGLNLIQADYNNDGCTDLLVLRGAWQPENVAQRKSLLRNNCNGTFTDVTSASGLAKATNTQTAVWADINNDGLLDLFVGNETGPSQLFLNKGDGTFEDISHSAGIDQTSFAKGVVAADYDNDGYMDFYVSNQTGRNFLYHNNHNGTFTEIASQAGVPGAGRGFAAWFFDYDNDGWPDLFVASYYGSVEESLKTYFGLPYKAGTLKLYRNLGNGAFQDVTKEAGLDKIFMTMGANFGDVDNDGYPDMYLGTGNPSYASLLPNVLLRNKDGKSFVDVTASSGTGELHKGHGVAFADLDNDGDEDIITSIGGAIPGDRHAFRLFENPGNGNDWISLKLVGVKANRSAIGARIKVIVKNQAGAARSIYRTVGSGGSFGGSPLQQHIGLGKSAQIVSIEIVWPGSSRTPQTFSNVAKNQFLEIKEFATEYTKLERPRFRLGGAKR
ncbi:MAG: FG-GAP-like repeat-containing protein [Bryobacteraceae bacterium]